MDDERRLLQRAQAGEADAFAALYERYARELYRRVLMPKLSDHAAAEDALAETFAALLHNLPRLDADDRSLWPWLVRVATRKALDHHRRHQRGDKALGGFERMMAPLLGETGGALVDRLSLQDSVRRCLAAIHERYARAIRLRFFEARTRAAAAADLGVTLGTFDVVLLRALKAFRKEWDALVAQELADGR